MAGDCETFIYSLAAKSEPDFDSEEIDNFLDQYKDICLNCRKKKALYIFQKLTEAGKRFIYKKSSPYLTHVGKVSSGPCTGSVGEPKE